MHQVDSDTLSEIQYTDTMAARVLRRLLDINMACAKEFPNQTRARARIGQQGNPRPTRRRGIQTAARKRLEELGHVLTTNGRTLWCSRCRCHRPIQEAQKWVSEGQCPGPPASSEGNTGLPRPPTQGAARISTFGRRRIHNTHRTTLIKGLLFC